MKRDCKLLIRTLPIWRAVVFFSIIPVIVPALKLTGYAQATSTTLMIVNMLLCSAFLLFRAGLQLCWQQQPAPSPSPRLQSAEIHLDEKIVHKVLQQQGYRLNNACTYAETGKWKSCAIAFTMVCSALLLLIGSADNLFQFSGVVMLGSGNPLPLNTPSTYTVYTKGPLMRFSALPYKLKGVERIFPDASFPYGAAQTRLLTLDNRILWEQFLPALGKSYDYSGFRFGMNALEYDVSLIMMTTDNHILYSNWIHFFPLVKPIGGYSHRGTLKKDVLNDVDGTALYNQVNDALKIELRYKKENFVVELGEAPNHEKKVANYIVKNDGIGRWSQLRVARIRHTPHMVVMAGLALFSGMVAVVSRRRRVWITSYPEGGCTLLTKDNELLNSLQVQL